MAPAQSVRGSMVAESASGDAVAPLSRRVTASSLARTSNAGALALGGSTAAASGFWPYSRAGEHGKSLAEAIAVINQAIEGLEELDALRKDNDHYRKASGQDPQDLGEALGRALLHRGKLQALSLELANRSKNRSKDGLVNLTRRDLQRAVELLGGEADEVAEAKAILASLRNETEHLANGQQF